MKRTSVVLLIVILVSLFGAGIASAQEPPADAPALRGERGDRVNIAAIIAEALDVDEDTLREAVQAEGATWASVITELGGDVETIQAQIVDAISAQLESNLEDVESRVDEMLNSPIGERRDNRQGRDGRGGLLEDVAEALDVDVEAVREAAQAEGATLNSAIESLGGDPDAIQSQVVAEIVERTNADADTVASEVAERFSTPLEELRQNRDGEGRPGRGGPRGGNNPPAAADGGDA